MLATPNRQIILEGCYNLRDTGGYLTRDGRQTRWANLFRADGLHQLPISSQEKLLAYSIRTVIDLRRPTEISEQPNVLAPSPVLSYLNISLVDNENEARELPDLLELNKRMLDNSQSQLKLLFETLANSARFPVLIHCTAGKDRTGLVIALLLKLVDVPDEVIAEDYALSAEYLSPLFDTFRQRAAQAGHEVAQFEKLLESRPETMLETLQYLETKYRGIRNYLSWLGLDNTQLETLQACLLE